MAHDFQHVTVIPSESDAGGSWGKAVTTSKTTGWISVAIHLGNEHYSLPILDTLQTNKFFAGERRYSH